MTRDEGKKKRCMKKKRQREKKERRRPWYVEEVDRRGKETKEQRKMSTEEVRDPKGLNIRPKKEVGSPAREERHEETKGKVLREGKNTETKISLL